MSMTALSMCSVARLFAPACPRHADALGRVGEHVLLNTELPRSPSAEMSYGVTLPCPDFRFSRAVLTHWNQSVKVLSLPNVKGSYTT